MAPQEITFPPGVQTVGVHVVYVRERWSYDWQPVPALHCAEASKSVAPTLPTATLVWKYGSVKTPADPTYAIYQKTTLKRWFVKIEFDSTDQERPWTWYGIIEDVVDRWGGNVSGLATGTEQLICYGLEKLLVDHLVLTSQVAFSTVDPVGRALTFNRDGLPNRSQTQLDTFVFENDPSKASYWTTEEIVKYLLRWQTPRDLDGFRQVPFELGTSLGFLDWDRVVLDQAGSTTYHLLSRLLDRRRLIVWWLDVNENENDKDDVSLYVETLNKDDIILPIENSVFRQNGDKVNLRCGDDETTRVVVTEAGVPVFDQVLVRGPRVRVVGTFSLQDGTLVAGWDSALTGDYDDGASNIVGYGGADVREQQRMNEEVRSRPELADVYRLYVLPDAWDGKVGDGLGGAKNALFYHRTSDPFVPDDVRPYYPDLVFEQTLPLKVGADYSGTNIADGTVSLPAVPAEELTPIMLFKRPDTTRWAPAHELGAASEGEIIDAKDNPRFSVYGQVARELAGIRLTVQGQPQHAVAYDAFVPLTADYDVGQYDVADGGFVTTLSLASDWHVEAVWPNYDGPESPPKPTLDAARIKIIYAPDRGHQVYVAPDTVVGVDDDGDLVTSDGGWIGQQDFDELLAVAKIAAAWYTEPHYVVYITTTRILARTDVYLGTMILELGDNTDARQYKEVNSVVTSLTITNPLGPPDGKVAATLKISTWAGELDTLELLADPSLPVRFRG